jgi:hypothetical protein
MILRFIFCFYLNTNIFRYSTGKLKKINSMINIKFLSGAVKAGAALCYGSGITSLMRLQAEQHL